MQFPDTQDEDGAWVVPGSRPATPREGQRLGDDVVYEPPLLPPLEHNPFKALLVPRPIAWISTRGRDGDNLSPYSFFGYLAPDVVFYAVGGAHVDGGEKDALRDARDSGEFCVNTVPWALRGAMSASAAEVPHGTDEFTLPVAGESRAPGAEVVKAACAHVGAPCVGGAALRLECRVLEFVAMAEDHDVVVIGRVVHTEGDASAPVAARGGYHNYFRIADEHTFLPDDGDAAWYPGQPP